jgi:hypothetical protein
VSWEAERFQVPDCSGIMHVKDDPKYAADGRSLFVFDREAGRFAWRSPEHRDRFVNGLKAEAFRIADHHCSRRARDRVRG